MVISVSGGNIHTGIDHDGNEDFDDESNDDDDDDDDEDDKNEMIL